ncbi:MAG: hypothetical protein JRN20_22665 [Nitrososphaerota archaeon]|nr:hypothetical protein [Nitrososphaerota archaeon]
MSSISARAAAKLTAGEHSALLHGALSLFGVAVSSIVRNNVSFERSYRLPETLYVFPYNFSSIPTMIPLNS